MRGARRVHEILAQVPGSEPRVLAVWLPMVDGDERERWQSGVLSDPRVTHVWDGPQAAGLWYAKNLTRPDEAGEVEWDAFFVYGRGARWAQDAAGPLAWGRTVIGKHELLERTLREALTPSTPSSGP